MKKLQLLNYIKERNEIFLKTYCDLDTYIGDDGEIKGVCQQVPAEEVMNFMSTTIHGVIAHMKDINTLD